MLIYLVIVAIIYPYYFVYKYIYFIIYNVHCAFTTWKCIDNVVGVSPRKIISVFFYIYVLILKLFT